MKQNKKFIEEQIGRTADAMTRDYLFSHTCGSRTGDDGLESGAVRVQRDRRAKGSG